MSQLQYLTPQDVLWINLQVAQRVCAFDYARLEDGTFFQYGYGGSPSIPAQAARFMSGFVEKAPFEAGNMATGFVAFVAFLRINGHDLAKSDAEAAAFVRSATPESIAGAIVPAGDGHHTLPVAEAVRQAIADYPVTLAALAEAVAA